MFIEPGCLVKFQSYKVRKCTRQSFAHTLVFGNFVLIAQRMYGVIVFPWRKQKGVPEYQNGYSPYQPIKKKIIIYFRFRQVSFGFRPTSFVALR